MNLHSLLFSFSQRERRKTLPNLLFLLFFFHLQYAYSLGVKLRKQPRIRNIRSNVGLHSYIHWPSHI